MADRAYYYALGKRKTARACVKLFANGKGDFKVNGEKLRDWADTDEMVLTVEAPLKALSILKDYDIEIRVSGGGKTAQAVAAQLGIARSLLKKAGEFRTQLREPGFLTRDSRVKERKKPGLKRARRAPQWSKR